MDSILTGIQDLISNPLSTPVGQLLEKATNSDEPSENWGMYMEICDVINETEDGPRDAIRAIRKLLTNNVGKNNVATLYTLTILETCVKNCGLKFHLQVVQKDFLQELVKIVTNKANAIVVIDRVLNLLQTWSDAFQGVEELREVSRVVSDLKQRDIEFPMTDLDLVSPIHTPARSTKPSATTGSEGSRPQNVEQQSATMGYDTMRYDHSAGGSIGLVLNDEQKAKLRSDLDIVNQNCKVMGEMLTELSPGQETADDWQLLQELSRTCRSMQQRVVALIEQVQNEDLTNVLLHVNDEVVNVLLRFDRFERLRGGQHTDTPTSVPNHQIGGAAPTGTLVDIGDSSAGHQTAASKPTGVQNDSEFDMFAASRQSYEQNQQALQHGKALYQADDQLAGGLGTAMNLKSQSDPYEPNLDKEEDIREMEEWTKANTLVAPSRQPQQQPQQTSATSSEFDQFLATRANAGTEPQTKPGGPAVINPEQSQASVQKPAQPTNRTIKKTDDDSSMFSL